jgi:hypothetical protein
LPGKLFIPISNKKALGAPRDAAKGFFAGISSFVARNQGAALRLMFSISAKIVRSFCPFRVQKKDEDCKKMQQAAGAD